MRRVSFEYARINITIVFFGYLLDVIIRNVRPYRWSRHFSRVVIGFIVIQRFSRRISSDVQFDLSVFNHHGIFWTFHFKIIIFAFSPPKIFLKCTTYLTCLFILDFQPALPFQTMVWLDNIFLHILIRIPL